MNDMEMTQYEAIQQAFSDMAAAIIRVGQAMARAIWEALEPLARWINSTQGRQLLIKIRKELRRQPMPALPRKRSTKRAGIYQRKITRLTI